MCASVYTTVSRWLETQGPIVQSVGGIFLKLTFDHQDHMTTSELSSVNFIQYVQVISVRKCQFKHLT